MNKLCSKELRIYLLLTSIVICGLAGSLITGPKIAYFGVSFPFSNIIFSILTYPIVDCICELWGKPLARQTLWYGLGCQLLLACLIQLSILAPPSPLWHLQSEYQHILSTGLKVVVASLIAFSLSQLLDLFVYQRIKEISKGKKLWLRTNISVYLGQALDSFIFIMIVFFDSPQKLKIILGSILVKIVISFLMTPIIYIIVIAVNRYLSNNTLAFKDETLLHGTI